MIRHFSFVGCLLLLVGCSPYVNIPAQRSDIASHNINSSTVRQVVTASLQHLLDARPSADQYVLVMPQGTSAYTFRKMFEQLPPGGSRLADDAGRINVYRVAGIQIRGIDAQVDIVPPSGSKPKRLMSVYLRRDLDGWYVYRHYLWNIPLDRALQLARPATRIEPIEKPQPQPKDQPQSPVVPETNGEAPSTATPPANATSEPPVKHQGVQWKS